MAGYVWKWNVVILLGKGVEVVIGFFWVRNIPLMNEIIQRSRRESGRNSEAQT